MTSINKFAAIIETERSKAPIDQILKLGSFNMESILSIDPNFFDDDEDIGNKKTHNTELIQSVGLSFKGNLHSQRFNMFMMELLRNNAEDLYRTKGLLSFHGQGNTKFVFQGVHEQINFGPSAKPWDDSEERINKFVFIGKNLNKDELRKGLMACIEIP